MEERNTSISRWPSSRTKLQEAQSIEHSIGWGDSISVTVTQVRRLTMLGIVLNAKTRPYVVWLLEELALRTHPLQPHILEFWLSWRCNNNIGNLHQLQQIWPRYRRLLSTPSRESPCLLAQSRRSERTHWPGWSRWSGKRLSRKKHTRSLWKGPGVLSN